MELPQEHNNGKGTEPIIETQKMKVNAKQLDIYTAADVTSEIVYTLSRDNRITVITNADNKLFYPIIDIHKSIIGYVEREYLVDEKAVLYARVPYTSTIMNNKDGTIPAKDNLVDVREYSQDIMIYMIFAYDNNFSGKALYERDLCLLQKGTLDKLLAAQKKFRRDGYGIKIYDAYRPQYVQEALFKLVNNPIYIANPKKASDHVRGAAVDMTLVDSKGEELEMPSPIHTFNTSSYIYSKTMTRTARKNMEYMQRIMLESGFLLYQGEWWHFKDADFEQYNITSHHFNDIEMVAAEK